MDTPKFILDLAKILIGNVWNRTGSVLVLLGASALTGWIDQAVAGIFKINIQPTATWIGFAVMLVGICMLSYSKAWPSSQTNSNSHPHDFDLLTQYRGLATSNLVRFLKEHHFRHPFRASQLEALEVLSDTWVTAHYEFHEPAMQSALENLQAEIREFNDLIGKSVFMDDRNPAALTAMPDSHHAHNPSVQERVRRLNETARKLAISLDSFERLAREHIKQKE